VEEGRVTEDRVHMVLSIPSKYFVAQVVGFMKGKGAICTAEAPVRAREESGGRHFWAGTCHEPTVAQVETACLG
jgi:putative transposase